MRITTRARVRYLATVRCKKQFDLPAVPARPPFPLHSLWWQPGDCVDLTAGLDFRVHMSGMGIGRFTDGDVHLAIFKWDDSVTLARFSKSIGKMKQFLS